MKNLKAKLNKQGGFTLIEMLIVVAIIAILIAVSIPLVNSSLERARETTDAANERSFKAVLTIAYANGKYDKVNPTATSSTDPFKAGDIYKYDAVNGAIVAKDADVNGYGKSTAYNIVDKENRKGQVLYGTYDEASGAVIMAWGSKDTALTLPQVKSGNKKLLYTQMIADN